MSVFIGTAALVVWIYLLAARGWFWRFRPEEPPEVPAAPLPRVAVVIPARNEAAAIRQAVVSLLAQDYEGSFRIYVVDDASTDGTAEAAQIHDSITLMPAGSLPPRWTGKLWALSEGVRAASSFNPEYYLFTDADIVHPPGNLTGLVAHARRGRRDLVSLMATLHCESLPERALIPAFVFFSFMLYPPRWIADPRRSTAGAAGGCILLGRRALERIGGFERIRAEMIDDCALAGAVKSGGGRIWLGLGPELRSIRPYRHAAEIARMIRRTAFSQLRHSPWLLIATLLGMALVFLTPVLLVRGPGGLAWVLMTLCYLPALRYYGRSALWAPLLPAIACFYMAATILSAADYWRGRGGDWKGRAQDPSSS